MSDKITTENCIDIMHTWFPRNATDQAKAWCTVHEFCCQNGLNTYELELDIQRPGIVKVIEFIGNLCKKEAESQSTINHLKDAYNQVSIRLESEFAESENKDATIKELVEVLQESDACHAYFEDFMHGSDGKQITAMRGKIQRLLQKTNQVK